MGFAWVILDATVPNSVFRMGFGRVPGELLRAIVFLQCSKSRCSFVSGDIKKDEFQPRSSMKEWKNKYYDKDDTETKIDVENENQDTPIEEGRALNKNWHIEFV